MGKGVKDLAERFSRYIIRKQTRSSVFSILDVCEFHPITNQPPSEIQKVAIVIPLFNVFSGGGTSIMRLGRSLAKRHVDVTYVSMYPASEQQISQFISDNKRKFGDFSSKVRNFENVIREKFDICIATSWKSVYYTKKLQGYKIYFVQDYEPYFFDVGDEYVLSRETYRLGFHIISLGQWNLQQIQKNNPDNVCKMDFIEFPYEPMEYPSVHRDYASYKNKKDFSIAIYIKNTNKRLPFLIQYMMRELGELFKQDDITLHIKYYGFNKKEPLVGGENVGKLTGEQLFQLYKESDFGMVASMTNISLVPYEMLATGLPVIEFEEGSYSYFLGKDTAILTGYDYRELYEKLLCCIKNPTKLEEMHQKAEAKLSTLSWARSCDQFWNILNGIKENG